MDVRPSTSKVENTEQRPSGEKVHRISFDAASSAKMARLEDENKGYKERIEALTRQVQQLEEQLRKEAEAKSVEEQRLPKQKNYGVELFQPNSPTSGSLEIPTGPKFRMLEVPGQDVGHGGKDIEKLLPKESQQGGPDVFIASESSRRRPKSPSYLLSRRRHFRHESDEGTEKEITDERRELIELKKELQHDREELKKELQHDREELIKRLRHDIGEDVSSKTFDKVAQVLRDAQQPRDPEESAMQHAVDNVRKRTVWHYLQAIHRWHNTTGNTLWSFSSLVVTLAGFYYLFHSPQSGSAPSES